MAVEHSQRKHALLSASKAERWLNCPPSARLEEKFNETHPPKTSIYAEEGTLAHELANVILLHELGELTDKEFQNEKTRIEKDQLYSSEMPYEVQKFVDYVLEQYAAAKAITPDAVCLIEQTLDFSEYVEQGVGIGDAVIIADGKMEVIDLKYGKGILVDPVENPQLSLYGLGAVHEYELMYEFDEVTLTIFQPRVDNCKSWTTTVDQLKTWGLKIVKPIAAKAYVGEGLHSAGPHCKWCSVKAMCYTLAQQNIKLARKDFKEPELLTMKELLDVFRQIPMLVDWANSVKDFLEAEAKEGKDIPGYKLVAGKANRKYTDEAGMRAKLLEMGYSEEDFLKTSLKGIPDVERLVGKAVFNKELSPYWDKPEGAPTLVEESDPRPAYTPEARAKSDFSE